MKTPSRFVLRSSLCTILIGSLLAVRTASANGPFEWQTATPESRGISSEKLDAFRDHLAAHATKSFLLVKDDRIVYEWYSADHSAAKPHFTASMAKALVGGMAVAVAMSDGRLEPGDPAAKFIPQWRNDPVKSTITLRQLGSHTSGLDDAEADDIPHNKLTGWKGDFWKRLPPPRDPFRISRDVTPVVFTPGERILYSNPGIAVLALATTAALKDAPEKDIRTLLRDRVMRPIGVPDKEWNVGYGQTVDVDGLPVVGTWGGGNFTARATARIARLMLRKGDWEGRRLIKPEAVRAVTSDVGLPGAGAIGFWSNHGGAVASLPRDAFWGAGAQHQIVLVIPSLKLIAVRNGRSLGDAGYDNARNALYFDPLMKAIGADVAGGTTDSEFPGDKWPRARFGEVGLSEARLQQARDYALTGGGSGIIIRRGKLVMEWGDTAKQYDLKSSTKSIGVSLLGLALKDGKVKLDDPAIRYHPTFGVPPESNRETGWLPKITLRHLANQVAGFEKPGGYGKLLFEPGTKWHYSDGGPNWLAECLTLVYGRDLNDVIFERVFTPIGIKPADIRWRENAYRPKEIDGVKRREFGAGFHANVHAMARIGYLFLREGRWKDQQILPKEFVQNAGRPAPEIKGLPENDGNHGNASEHYGLLWWNNGDGTLAGVPRDAYWSWGLYEGLIIVIPSLDMVIARAGKSWGPRDRPSHTSEEHYSVLKPFLVPIVQATRAGQGGHGSNIKPSGPPYPPSPVIQGVAWAPKDEMIQLARGSDTWPTTWGDDGALYSAYGDGHGFKPFVPEKLSMGIVKVTGNPPDVQGFNIRSESGEFHGDGRSGRKASGMLMVDGVLYILTRNVDNSQLGWSHDHGVTWTWADWKFTTSFGAPTFLNFGKNYAGARDDFVYVYSHDNDSAYEAGDRMVMARVSKKRIRDRGAYEFFVRLDSAGRPQWSRDIEQRGAVFTNRGNCYRNGITYNAGLKRYIWCQILPHSTHPQGMRFQGGFGIYDAPEPWGPWTTAFYTEAWDVGPGETNSFPTKWMSADGKTMHLLSSTDDHFSVRKASLKTSDRR